MGSRGEETVNDAATDGDSTDADMARDIEPEENTIEIVPEESVYFYSTFMPSIQRHKYGRFCTCEMVIGILLFMLNLIMQIGLTYVVGQGVVEESNAWRYSLLKVDPMQTRPKTEPASFLFGPQAHKYDSWDPNVGDRQLPDTWDPVGHLVSDAEEKLGFEQHVASQTSLLQNHEMHRRSSRPHHTHHVYNLDVSPPKDDLVFHLRHKNSRPVRRHTAGKKGGKDLSGPLCYPMPPNSSTYSCLPWSALYVQYWKKLDTNNDGVWSHEEAVKDEGLVGKVTGIAPKLVFSTIVHGLEDRKKIDQNITESPMMTQLEGIPKAYFDYWSGDAMICSYSDPEMCSTLISRGFFDAAMDPAHAGSKGVSDLESAMDYCKFMLKEGGGCDQSMPQIYQLYRAKRKEECQDMHLHPLVVYTNPFQKEEAMYVITPEYEALDGYLKSETMTFRVFMFLVLLLWLLALVQELREMLKLVDFCISFPKSSKKEGRGVKTVKVKRSIQGQENEYDTQIEITGVSHRIRAIIAGVCIYRTVVVLYLGTVGCIFLINEFGYMDLLMNAVALAFILEIDEILFQAVSRGTTLTTLEEVQPMTFTSMIQPGGVLHFITQKDFIALVLMPILCIVIMSVHNATTTKPVLAALNCACYQLGEPCFEASTYDKAWWTNYWSSTLPNAIGSMATAAAGSLNSTPAAPAPAPAPTPAL